MIRGRWGESGLLIVVFALLIAAAGPTAVGAAGDGGGAPSSFDATGPSSDPGAAQQAPPGENNSSVAHRNPSEVSDDESLTDVELWLSREMTERLSESAAVSREDSERARELVGNDSEYAELARQYAEVTNRSGSEGADDFAAAGQLQRQFFADVEQYRRVHEAYRNASEADETDRAVRLAHELERRAAAVNRTAVRLNDSYADVSADGQGDLRNATRTIGDLRGNVTRTQLTVRDRTLVRTELSVEATEPGGSFADPVSLAGRLRTADGDPVADENVTLRIGNRTVETTTDAEGRFEVAYRPTHAAVGDRPRTVAFRPDDESAYLWATADVSFEVRQVTPNVTVSNRTEGVRFNETLTVNGTVAAEEVGVPNVPVVVTVDGVRIAQSRTDADGSFGAAGRLPANVSNGSQQVRVRVVPENATAGGLGPSGVALWPNYDPAFDAEQATESDATLEPARDAAIAPANGSAEITVESTPTTLSVAEVRTFNETAFVAGRLTTEDGRPLSNRTVELRIDGRSVGEATTNETGGYATTVGLPPRLLGGDSTVRVVAAYEPSGGNLAPATADRTATVGSSGPAVSDRHLRYGAAGLLAVAALGAIVRRFRSSGGRPSDRGADTGEAGADARSTDLADVRGRSAEALFDAATAALEDGAPDAAVVAAYGAVRRRLGGEVGIGPRTHWEFYADCRDAGLSEEHRRRLERLTEIYERAAFADESVSEDGAREAVADATALREAADSGGESLGEGVLDDESLDGGSLEDGRPERDRPGSGPGDADGSPAD